VGTVIGIDLGTVNSCVAYLKEGIPTVISDEEGRPTTPSIYAPSNVGDPLVGYAAQAQQEQNRFNTIFAVKRFIGLKFDSTEVKEAQKRLPYKIISAKNGDAWVEVEGQPVSPEEISAGVLSRMKQVAEHYFKEPVTKAVVTVPAHFNDAQRQATRDAARICGLEVLRVINEPTAAALAYGLDHIHSGEEHPVKIVGKRKVEAEKVVAVFDLGGGTFDISILALRSGVFDVLATQGDTYLGGEDFDLLLQQFILNDFKSRTGVDLSQTKQILQKLKLLSRDAKHDLSDKTSTRIFIPFVTKDHNLDYTIDRRLFEEIVAPALKRCEGPCIQALKDAGLKPDEVDVTILVGGMTKVPAVKKLCQKVFKKIPDDSVNPDEAVALGAAIQAGVLEGLLKGVSLNDVTSLTLGLEIQGGMVFPIIHRNTKIPTSKTEIFTTSAPNQPQVSIHVIQGESDFAPDNKTLGRFELTGLKPAPRGAPKIGVTFSVDGDGIVQVSAKDEDTGEIQSIEIVASSGLTDEEIDDLLRENFTLSEQKSRIGSARRAPNTSENSNLIDQELTNALEELRRAIYIYQWRLDTEGQNFKGVGRQTMENCLQDARNALESPKNIDQLKNSLTALSMVTALFEKFLEQ
jgi:molecular chaperone DnaK